MAGYDVPALAVIGAIGTPPWSAAARRLQIERLNRVVEAEMLRIGATGESPNRAGGQFDWLCQLVGGRVSVRVYRDVVLRLAGQT